MGGVKGREVQVNENGKRMGKEKRKEGVRRRRRAWGDGAGGG